MTKKIFITLFIFIAFINISVFADAGNSSSSIQIADHISSDSLNGGENMSTVLGTATFKNPFAGMFKFYSEIIIGLVGGVLMTFRLGIELFHAIIMNDASGSIGEVRKVLMRFLIHFIVAVIGASAVFWAFNIHI